jgi:hypothetical protein
VGIFLPVFSVSYFLSYSQFINDAIIIIITKVLLPRHKWRYWMLAILIVAYEFIAPKDYLC